MEKKKSYKTFGIKLPELPKNTNKNQSTSTTPPVLHPKRLDTEDDNEDDNIDESYFLRRERKVYMIQNPVVDEDKHGDLDHKENKSELDNIIDELIATETSYISTLNSIIDNYSSLDVGGTWHYIAGNLPEIIEEAQKFLELINRNKTDVNKVAYVFINAEAVLNNIMIKYAKNVTTSRKYLEIFKNVVQAKDNELGKKICLQSDLMLPIRHLSHCKLILERIQKEMVKSSASLNNIACAIDVIKNVLQICNNYVASASIKCDNFDMNKAGPFIMKENFSVLKPTKFTSVVFLFENVIIFTEDASKEEDLYMYVDSIETIDLSISRADENIFHLIRYGDSRKSKNKTVTYVLQANHVEVKNKWVAKIEALLWEQARKVKGGKFKTNNNDNY